jgi:hypothetical protein
MRRSALPCHVPPLDSKTSFSAKCHKNFGFTPAFLLICAELPQRRFFFGTSARLIAVARVHSLPGMVGNFLISVDILPPRAPFFATCRRGLLDA